MVDLRHPNSAPLTDRAGASVHLSDIELELYSLNRLHPAFFPPMEEHLLWCQECVTRLEDFDQFHTAIKHSLLT